MSYPNLAENQWMFQHTVDTDQIRKSLQKEQQKLARERRQLELDKEKFRQRRQMEERRLEHESRLFEMKWKLLEDEVSKLAVEKEQLKAERRKNRYISQESSSGEGITVKGRQFFSGVNSELGMKKRYKDLIKIYHPDNMNGDTGTLQIINREYDELKKIYCF